MTHRESNPNQAKARKRRPLCRLDWPDGSWEMVEFVHDFGNGSSKIYRRDHAGDDDAETTVPTVWLSPVPKPIDPSSNAV